jgi:hypothetical protein
MEKQRMWNVKISVILTIGATGTISKSFTKYVSTMQTQTVREHHADTDST